METQTRRRTLSPLRGLQNEVNELFDSLFPVRMDQESMAATDALWSPRMDLTESDDAFHLIMDIPGVAKNDIAVRMEDGRLTVQGTRQETKESADRTFVRRERSLGSFFRSVRVPTSVDENKIKASHQNGVLRITLPKSEKSKPKQIKVA